VIAENVPRISLIDTFADEKFETLRVAEALGDRLTAVRLDTPGSRRGDFYRILEEVRWELDLRGHTDVELFVSGGIDERQIRRLNPVADGYGVGTWISAAPVVDFAMDIVEIDGEPLAKRGKWSGAKQVLRCESCDRDEIVPFHRRESWPDACKTCGSKPIPLLAPVLEDGAAIERPPKPVDLRDGVLARLAGFEIDWERSAT
jgi:nicotinate phosphoribosyltransferase